MDKCKEGLTRFIPESCGYCKYLSECEVAKEGRVRLYEKKKKELEERRKKRGFPQGFRDKRNLICMYCGANALQCRCKNKPSARIELRLKKK